MNCFSCFFGLVSGQRPQFRMPRDSKKPWISRRPGDTFALFFVQEGRFFQLRHKEQKYVAGASPAHDRPSKELAAVS